MDINLGLTADATGTANAITATYSVAPTLVDKKILFLVASLSNSTTTPTFAPNGLTARVITKNGGNPLAAGDIVGAGFVCILEYNLANTRWELLNPRNSVDLSAYLTSAAAALAYQPLDDDLTAIAGLSPTNNDIIQRKSGAWINRSITQLTADLPNAATAATGVLTSTDWNTFNGKQAALVSGTNIKTINNTTVLGSGNINIQNTLAHLSVSGKYRPCVVYNNTFLTSTGYSGIQVYQKISPSIDITVTSLSIICSTAVAGQNVRLSLYTDSAGSPNALISGSDTGNISCAATGLKEGAITPVLLSAGSDYWVMYQASSGSIGFRYCDIVEMTIYNPSDFLYYSAIRKAVAYGVPPATAPTGFTYSFSNGGYNLAIYLKIQ
jgi:hypothetical protein